jgi:SAM-dependent methyltransferase
MEADEYAKMAALEQDFWWYQALRDNLAEFLPPEGGRLLDAGCGTGGMLTDLARRAPGWSLTGLEYDGGAAAVAARKSGMPVVCGSINVLPFATGSFDLVLSSDVLCHAGVTEAAALSECARVLRPGGRLLLNLPAYRWLLSAHDARVHNARRYTLADLAPLLAAQGFAVEHATYWNSLLFPLMAAKRLLSREDAASDVARLPWLVEAGFRAATQLETACLSAGMRLPFGGSLLVRARLAA